MTFQKLLTDFYPRSHVGNDPSVFAVIMKYFGISIHVPT